MYFQLPVSAVLQQTLLDAALQLASVSDAPRDEAEWLLCELLGVHRSDLRVVTVPPTPEQQARYEAWVARRAAGEPFAYITGNQPFRRLMLQVSPAVLIPRGDTEQLVSWALEILATHDGRARVLDACTGSGCVALALADEAPQHAIWASDCSPQALAVAQANALNLQLPVRFKQADGLSLPEGAPRFHLITANPPYIAEGDHHLADLGHEPALALVSGADGLTLLRQLILQAPNCLEADSWLLLEHGYNQGEAVRALLRERGFAEVSTRRDYGGNERISGGRWNPRHD